MGAVSLVVGLAGRSPPGEGPSRQFLLDVSVDFGEVRGQRADLNGSAGSDGDVAVLIDGVAAEGAGEHGDVGQVAFLVIAVQGALFDVRGNEEGAGQAAPAQGALPCGALQEALFERGLLAALSPLSGPLEFPVEGGNGCQLSVQLGHAHCCYLQNLNCTHRSWGWRDWATDLVIGAISPQRRSGLQSSDLRCLKWIENVSTARVISWHGGEGAELPSLYELWPGQRRLSAQGGTSSAWLMR